eukprot:8367156-Alexandrium_andersonii.AAC.1
MFTACDAGAVPAAAHAPASAPRHAWHKYGLRGTGVAGSSRLGKSADRLRRLRPCVGSTQT